MWNGGWYVISTPVSNIGYYDFVNIVGVFDNNNILLYVNGVLVDQAYGSVSNAGNIVDVGYYNFSGNIDNLSVWETAITQQEV